MDFVRQNFERLSKAIATLRSEQTAIKAKYDLILQMCRRPPSVTEEIDQIAGRRIFYNLAGTGTFTTADNGQRGQQINMLVSQDGAFVQTHYPFVLWRPSAPATATNLDIWRPVAPSNLPTQALSAGNFDLNEDIISISYEVVDGGSQRNFQNQAVAPILSRPDNLVPLPVPTLFTPNTTVQFIPTFNTIRFTAAIPPTAGIIAVVLPGYRIVNM